MIGPTGVGKTEIARRLARLADAPFIKVEATKFTEVGYVGKDVDTIVRDLVDTAVKQERETQMRAARARAEDAAEERVLDILVPPPRSGFGFAAGDAAAGDNTARQVMRKRLREGKLDDNEIEIEVAEARAALEIMAPPGMEEMAEQLRGLFANLGQAKKSKRKLRIADAMKAADRRGSRQAGQRRRDARARARERRRQRHRLHRRDRQGGVAQRDARRRCVAPGRAARPAAAGRRHRPSAPSTAWSRPITSSSSPPAPFI